jgi:transcriptional regulator with XRE-family HTH domain
MSRPVRTDHPQASKSEIGLRVKARREALGITQAELARRADMSPAHVAFIEQGRRKDVKPATLAKLAQGLECTVDDLLRGSAQPANHRALETFIRKHKVPRVEADAMREAEQLVGSHPDELLLTRLWDLVHQRLSRR